MGSLPLGVENVAAGSGVGCHHSEVRGMGLVIVSFHLRGLRHLFPMYNGNKTCQLENFPLQLLLVKRIPLLQILYSQYRSPVKRICVFEHCVMTNFNRTCPAIQRG